MRLRCRRDDLEIGAFAVAPNPVDQVRADYERMIAALPGRQLFVLNVPSAPAHERVQNYRLLDET